jgi:hypothetical protein
LSRLRVSLVVRMPAMALFSTATVRVWPSTCRHRARGGAVGGGARCGQAPTDSQHAGLPTRSPPPRLGCPLRHPGSCPPGAPPLTFSTVPSSCWLNAPRVGSLTRSPTAMPPRTAGSQGQGAQQAVRGWGPRGGGGGTKEGGRLLAGWAERDWASRCQAQLPRSWAGCCQEGGRGAPQSLSGSRRADSGAGGGR